MRPVASLLSILQMGRCVAGLRSCCLAVELVWIVRVNETLYLLFRLSDMELCVQVYPAAESVRYALRVMDGVRLFGRAVRLREAT